MMFSAYCAEYTYNFEVFQTRTIPIKFNIYFQSYVKTLWVPNLPICIHRIVQTWITFVSELFNRIIQYNVSMIYELNKLFNIKVSFACFVQCWFYFYVYLIFNFNLIQITYVMQQLTYQRYLNFFTFIESQVDPQ